jgi:hypothetical protein
MNKKELSQIELDEIENFLELDENDLYALIPIYLKDYTVSREFHSPNLDDYSDIEEGKKQFQIIQEPVYKKLCQDWDLCKKIGDPIVSDQIGLVVVIADVIAPVVVGLPLFLISSILIKIGLRKFCNCPR